MTFKLRDYQTECLSFTDLALAKYGAVANVLPTGAGKTVIFAHLAQQHLVSQPLGRVLILVHTDELVQQAYDKVRIVNLGTDVGIVKAERDETSKQIIVASVQTLRQSKRRDRITGVTLIIVDECHHATAPTYRAIIDHYTKGADDAAGTPAGDSAFSARLVVDHRLSDDHVDSRRVCKVVGFTATLGRSDEADLSKVWQHVAYRRDILWMIRNEYLIDVRGLHVKVDDLDLKKVKKSRGDFQDADLGQALSDAMAPEVVARALKQHAPDRKTICFTPLVASAYEFAEAFEAEGFKAEVVHGALPKAERREILRRFRDGVTQVVCNAMVLTEGFDDPGVSCIIVARPTKSKILFQQMVGRGLRVDPERPWSEQDCLVMIVAGAEMHDLRSIVDLTEKQLRPKPDQTLLEAEEEEERGDGAGAREQKPQWRGATKVKEFDPLMRASRRTWAHTAGTNTRYLPAGDFYILLMENPDTADAWDVCWITKKGNPAKAGRTEYTGIPLDLAMDWGEDVADRMGGDAAILNTKGKTWRRKQIEADSPQVQLARRLGIEIAEGWRKGDLAEAIDLHFASNRIDPQVTAFKKWLKEREQG